MSAVNNYKHSKKDVDSWKQTKEEQPTMITLEEEVCGKK